MTVYELIQRLAEFQSDTEVDFELQQSYEPILMKNVFERSWSKESNGNIKRRKETVLFSKGRKIWMSLLHV